MTERQSPIERVWAGAFGLLLLCACPHVGCGSDDDGVGDEPPRSEPDPMLEMNDSDDGDQGMGEPDQGMVAEGAPTATGPIEVGEMATSSFIDLDSRNYSEKEFFFEGEATSYSVDGTMNMDGKWTLVEAGKAPFKSRLYVRRPIDDDDFNGTVVVEWLNVSAGADGDPGFMYNWKEVMREGYVWVGVSAQAVGIEGGGLGGLLGGSATAVPLKQFNPERYGSLVHPGDAYSFDIFTQAARVVRGEAGIDVLDGLEAERLIAYGESQSAGRLTSYVDGVHPIAKAYDGYFIHSRGAAGTPFEASGFGGFAGGFAGLGAGGGGHLIRDDIDAKVLQFQTETDVTGYLGARQPDNDNLRTWEVTGTAHADVYLTTLGGEVEEIEGAVSCEGGNDGPQQFVIKAALHQLNQWLVDGTPPPSAERMETDDSGAFIKDEYGNTLGGVRSPDVDVPIATHSGSPPAGGGGGGWCFLFGSTVPFDSETLMQLYPSHEDYVAKVADAAREAREAGFLLPPEEEAMVAEAQDASVPE